MIDEREIPLSLIERVLDCPELIIPDRDDAQLEHRLKIIPELENRVLRVLINPKAVPIKIITLYFDRTMRGKL
jgi:hypothetical protein